MPARQHHTSEQDILLACENAIRDHYHDLSGRIDIRLLWSRDRTFFFRVNWWRRRVTTLENYIAASEFVAVEIGHEHGQVPRETVRAA